jgi:class 3 adenylate cyclase
MYQKLSAKMEADSIKTALSQKQKEDEILRLRQQKEIADLKVEAAEREKEKQERTRKTLILIALIIFAGIIVTLYFYLSKRREHTKLTVAYVDLNKTRKKLEKAEKRIVTLLKQQVSGDVATELLTNKKDRLGESRFVCVMFLDIRDFTPIAEKMSPEKLIAFQNEVFGFMIDIVLKNHGIINQLLGDGFMATFGAPVSHGNDCQNAFSCAQQILTELQKRNGTEQNIKVGIGLHAGYVVTGNVGNEERKQYSVTGNTVILASRVEQLNKKYNSSLIITEEVYNQLDSKNGIQADFTDEKVKGRKEAVRILKIN